MKRSTIYHAARLACLILAAALTACDDTPPNPSAPPAAQASPTATPDVPASLADDGAERERAYQRELEEDDSFGSPSPTPTPEPSKPLSWHYAKPIPYGSPTVVLNGVVTHNLIVGPRGELELTDLWQEAR